MASGTRNPLHYRQLVNLTSTWFTQNPLYDRKGQPIAVPEWSFPGRGAVERQLERAQKNLDRADKALKLLPLRGKQAMINAEVEDKKEMVGRAAAYVKIYGAYAECEALYGVEGLVDLHQSLETKDQEDFCCDPAIIRWDRYVTEVTCHRLLNTPGSKPPGNGAIRMPGRLGSDQGSSPRSAIWPPSISRTRSSPATLSSATRGWQPATSHRGTGCGSP